MNNKQIISDTESTTIISTTDNHNLKIKAGGTGLLQLESTNDMTLTASSGNIELKGTVEIQAGKKLIASDGNGIAFANDIVLDSGKNITVSGSGKFIGIVDGITDKGSGAIITGTERTQNTTNKNNITAIEADNWVTTAKVLNDNITADKLVHDINLVGHPTTTTQTTGNISTRIATTEFVSIEINNLIDSAPGTLNTLNELAAA